MPQATDELRAKWGIDMQKAKQHLERNFTLTKDWRWALRVNGHVIDDEDRSAAEFLIQEWDFDGIDMEAQHDC